MGSRNEGVVVVTKINDTTHLVECSMCGWRQVYQAANTADWCAFTHNRTFRKEGCDGPTKNEYTKEEREMLNIYDVSEADEAATDKTTALYNLRAQVSQGETPAIIDMYERAAWGAGATVAETEEAIRQARRK